MPVAERTRERSKFYAGAAVAAIGAVATIAGIVISSSYIAAEASGANSAVATGSVTGVGFTADVTFDADDQLYAVRLLVPLGGSADNEREARTVTCEIMGSDRAVTAINGSQANVQTLVNGAYEIGQAQLPAGPASVRCGWESPTDADARRGITREFDVVPVHPGYLESGAAIAFSGIVAFLAGALVVAIGWKRFRITS